MSYVVCGPPRSATTFMLEAIAAHTTLGIRWRLDYEWKSRDAVDEHFYEQPCGLAADTVCKVLDPSSMPSDVTRGVLMVRDPSEVVFSLAKLGQRISVEGVQERVQAFRELLGSRCDEVTLIDLLDLDALFARLGESGWPVVDSCYCMETRAVR